MIYFYHTQGKFEQPFMHQSRYTIYMPVVILNVSSEIASQIERPATCPYCGSSRILSWGQVHRTIQDYKPVQLAIHRNFCEYCKHTFRSYPQGIDRSPYSLRFRRLAGLLWLMDLSCRDIVDIFQKMGISINRMTIWREGQDLVNYLTSKKIIKISNLWSLERYGDFESHRKGSTSLAVSLEPGHYSEIGTIITSNPQLVVSWLRSILRDLDIEVLLLETKELKDLTNVNNNGINSY